MNNFNNFNNFNNMDYNYGNSANYGYNNYNYPSSTNIVTVTSLDEAIMKTTLRGSDMTYFDQDKPVFYRVKMDMDGRKYWMSFNYDSPKQDNDLPATKNDFSLLLSKIQSIEEKLGIKEVSVDVKSDGQNAVQSSSN